MLRKPPQGRPTLERVSFLLDNLLEEKPANLESKGFQALAQVGAIDAEASIRADISRMAQSKVQRERDELLKNALNILRDLAELFYDKCSDVALTLKRTDHSPNMPSIHEEIFSAHLGTASIEIRSFNPTFGGILISKDAFKNSGWDVVVGATIIVSQGQPNPYKWGANLWYTNLGTGSEFRWWEVSYYNVMPRQDKLPFEPHAVDNIKDADLAASRISHSISIATKPRPIDDEDADSFCDRWAEILAKAYHGKLEYPRNLPLR